MSSVAKLSYIAQRIAELRETILTGTLLAVDPSTGSSSSLPGYALYEKGILVESGVIRVDVAAAKNKRLFEIRRTLQEDFEVPDVLVIEHISAIAFGALKYNAEAFVGLHRGVGAILSAFNLDTVIEVPPSVWKRKVDEGYTKSDESDAVYIGRYVINEALAGRKEETNGKKIGAPRRPLTTKKVQKQQDNTEAGGLVRKVRKSRGKGGRAVTGRGPEVRKAVPGKSKDTKKKKRATH